VVWSLATIFDDIHFNRHIIQKGSRQAHI